MPSLFTEDTYEHAIIELFENMGYDHLYAPDLDRDYSSPLLDAELRNSLVRINRGLPVEAIDEALSKLKNFDTGSLLQKNIIFMDYLQNGITVKYAVNGEERSSVVRLIDYTDAAKNDFYVVNQYTFVENGNNRRPDIILFINGMPLVLMELKSPSKDEVGAENAYNQIRNYMQDVPSLFYYNAICVISDLSTNKAGTITSGLDRFMEWKTKDGDYENTAYAQFDTFYEGMFQKERLLDILKNFILFSGDGQKQFKILAGYHQYFAVRKAIEKAKRTGVGIVTVRESNHFGIAGYYAKMAVAWAVSVYFAAFPDEMLTYLQDGHKLDEFTYKKSLQKITESYRVDKEMKKIIKEMRQRG